MQGAATGRHPHANKGAPKRCGEEATRSQMLVSLVNRREQMVSDGLMLS